MLGWAGKLNHQREERMLSVAQLWLDIIWVGLCDVSQTWEYQLLDFVHLTPSPTL